MVQVQDVTISGTVSDANGELLLVVMVAAFGTTIGGAGANVTYSDEVVVVGYGTKRKGSITGAFSSVSIRKIRESRLTDAGSALQGREAGVICWEQARRWCYDTVRQ